MHVDRAVESFQRLALHQIHEGFAREHAACILGERDQKRELVAGERALLPVHTHAARIAVDFKTAEPQERRPPSRFPAPENRAQAGEELARLERLGQIVVGADLQADDAVCGIPARGEHQHRRVLFRAQLAAHLESVDVGQHQVEHQRVKRLMRKPLESGAASGLDRNAKPRLAEILGNHLGEPGIVFDQENALGHAS